VRGEKGRIWQWWWRRRIGGTGGSRWLGLSEGENGVEYVERAVVG